MRMADTKGPYSEHCQYDFDIVSVRDNNRGKYYYCNGNKDFFYNSDAKCMPLKLIPRIQQLFNVE